jgi:hypothetical protein
MSAMPPKAKVNSEHRIMKALAAGPDAAVQMIDTSVVRVAWSLHRGQQSPRDGSLTRGADVQDSRGGVHQRPAGPWPSRPVKRTTIGCVRFSSARCFHKRCCSQIVDATRIGSGSLPVGKEHGETFRRNETVTTRSASARICIVRAICSNGSSTRSSNVGVSRPDTTNSRQTIWRSSSLHQSEFGCVLMSPRPRRSIP